MKDDELKNEMMVVQKQGTAIQNEAHSLFTIYMDLDSPPLLKELV